MHCPAHSTPAVRPLGRFFSIRKILLSVLLLLAVVHLFASLPGIHDAWRAYEAFTRIEIINHAANHLVLAARSFGFERGRAYIELLERGPVQGEGRKIIWDRRREGEADLAQALALLAGDESFGQASSRLTTLAAARSRAERLRQQVDEVLLLESSSCDKSLPDNWFAVMEDLIGSMEDLMADLSFRLSPASHGLSGLAFFRLNLFGLLNTAGPEVALLAAVVASGQPIPANVYERVLVLRGQSQEHWQALDHFSREETDPRLREAVDRFRLAYREYLPKVEEVLEAAHHAGPYALSPQEFLAMGYNALEALVPLSDTLVVLADEQAVRLKQDAVNGLIRQFASLGVVLVCILLGILVVQHHVLSPVTDAMNQSLSLLSTTLESTADGILVTDAAGRMVLWNHKFVQMWGLSEAVLESRDDSAALLEASMQFKVQGTFMDRVGELYSQPGAIGMDLLELQDGRYFERYSQPQSIGDTVVGRVWSFRDVTGAKQAEAALREAQYFAQRIIETTPNLIYIYDLQEQCHVYANPRTAQFLGLSHAAIHHWGDGFLLDLVHPEDVGKVAEHHARLVDSQDGEVLEAEYRVWHTKGEWLSLHSLDTVFSRDAQGQPRQIIGSAQDITERKRNEEAKKVLERELRFAQKMEAVGSLAGGIAHEFNNLLAIIMGFSEIVLDEARSGRADPEDISQVLRAAERGRDMVRQILTFSCKVNMELKPLDLNAEVKQAVGLLSKTLPRMIRIETELAPDLKPTGANADQMVQVILNLASNAQDVMPEGGKLTIRTQNATVQAQKCLACGKPFSGEFIVLTVSDTGCGMDQRTLERIFEPFFTTKEVGKGTGLGMAIVFGIVSSHRGHIQCETKPGAGTTFRIFLPVIEAELPVAKAVELPAPPPGGCEKLLLVDDDEAVAQVGARTLRNVGYQVSLAQSGEEALEIFDQNGRRFDAVILDLGMPGMGGYKCLQKILASAPQAKVIIASGYATDGSPKEALAAGALGFVAKPFHKTELLEAVRRVLDA